MMNLFKTVKGKVIAGTLSAVLLVGGVGAATYATNAAFKDFFDNATTSLFINIAGWAGLEVQNNGKDKKSGIEGQIQGEFDAAAGDVEEHYGDSVNNGNKEVNKAFDKLSKEITKSIKQETKEAKDKITETVDNEVTASKASLEQAAQDKAQALIDAANNRIGNPGYVPTVVPGQTP